MATAKKATPKAPATPSTAKKAVKTVAAPAKKAAASATKATAAPAKKTATTQVKKAAAVPAKKAAAPAAKAAPAAVKPIKEGFTKAGLATHLATQAGVEPKVAKAVLAALEATILGAVHKKGHGEFTMPGLLKIGVQKVEAKKKRFGKDPFTGTERWFPAKPASVRIKARALKKLKDAAA
ncbi:HU family DNA-binding protein [uncultured Xylophilus sp.]|uniref:HU family DNA-binding protein n=1 Tax=uncultured Xylophilus sp. TaxID=296832 RepID=UPI0025E01518|nr:HU family DNA-binding protein [uncultured Xylophilus sp.]